MASDKSLKLPSGVTLQQQREFDLIAWSNQEIPKNKGNLFVFTLALVFVFMGLSYFTYQLLMGGLNNKTLIEQIGIFIFYLLTWMILLGVLSIFQSLTWIETVKISETHITVLYSGRGASKNKRFNKDIVQGLSFENYHLDGREFYPSINILFATRKFGIAGRDRQIIANWMRTNEKYQLFILLQHILKKRGWDIDFRFKDGYEK